MPNNPKDTSPHLHENDVFEAVSDPTQPDWEQAGLFAEASRQSYDLPGKISQWVVSNIGSADIQHIHEKNTHGFIVETQDRTIISFRGSKGLRNWIGNMDALHKEVPYGAVHSGFFKAFKVVQDQVFLALIRAREANRPVVLTGHSLGGALATLTAAYAQYEIGPTPIEAIYTYGMPKFCDPQAAAYTDGFFGDRIFRFVNNKDIVTRIPPGSHHVGECYWFDENGKFIPQSQEDVFESLEGTERAELNEADFRALKQTINQPALEGSDDAEIFGLIDAAKDHGIAEYVALIKQNRL